MARIDAKELVTQMVQAATGVLKGEWKRARTYAEPEFKELARIAADIEANKRTGAITEAQAQSLMEMHRKTLKTVSITLKAQGLIAAEQAANAALEVAAKAINTVTGWHIL